MDSIYDALQWFCYLISTVLLVPSLYLLYLHVKNRNYVTLINKLPGPKTVLFFGNSIPLLKTPRTEWFYTVLHEIEEFVDRPLCRFWFKDDATVFVNDPQAIQSVLTSNALLDKSNTYDYFRPWLGFGLLTSTGERWRSHRKLITPTFHFGILDEFFKVFVNRTDDLVNILEDMEGKDYFDIHPYLTRCTLDIICETAMGKSLHAQSDKNSIYVEAVINLAHVIKRRKTHPLYRYDFIFNMSRYAGIQKKCLEVLHGFTNQVIKERWAELSAQTKDKVSPSFEPDDDLIIGRKRRVAFLDMLLEIYRDSQKLNFKDIREEVDTFMFGGHDTTSVALCWIFYNIGRFPDVQQRLHEEIDAVFGNSKRSLTKEDLTDLKYMDLVIKESLRMFPPAPMFSRRTAENTDLCGYTIPAGTNLSIHTYLLHRNEKYFPDPERFDPDRFLPENCVNRHPYAYIPFSAGLRNCIGQKFAMMELKTVICQILKKFKFTSKHRVDEVKMIAEFVLRPGNGMWIKLERRELE